MAQHRYMLPEDRIPDHWYNIAADLPSMPPPPLNPGTGEPLGPEALAGIFPMSLIEQEVSQERYIAIPDPVREIYAMWRPTPMYRALGLEKALGTTCKIFYKYEGVSPAGSHKPNTSVPQAYYNAQAGIKRLTTETGAGQWGSSLSFACNLFDIECKVFMVRVSYDSKPYRRLMMETWGGQCVASPSEETNAGRAILAEHPDSSGSLGIAISEAVEQAAMREDTNYALGSVLNHVLLHQTVVGQEAKEQLEMAGAYPDVVVGCVGGGSNFGGIAFPFLQDKIAGKDIRIVAVEPASCPTLTRGTYGYDFGDTAQTTPLLPMYSLGHDFIPPSIHSGGLRYHGMSPLVSHVVHSGLVEATSHSQVECFTEAVRFARAEGIIPAPEPSHAIRQVVEEVNRAKEEGVEKTSLFNLCGHGHFDMQAYMDYFAKKLQDYEYPEHEVAMALAGLPSVDAA